MKKTVTFGEIMLRLKTPEYLRTCRQMGLRQATEAQRPM